MTEAIDAATVIPLRDGPDGLEVLLLRRDHRLGSFAGMWVFPGGRIEDEDHTAEADTEQAARRAAVREAAEEADLVLDPASLRYFSHWSPPARPGRRFATWFFLAPAPDTAVTVDRGEVHEHAWLRPTAALARRDADELELAPPTVVTLVQLQRFATVADALTQPHEPEVFQSRFADGADPPVLLWHGDVGYTDGDWDRPGPRHRLVMAPQAFRYERTL